MKTYMLAFNVQGEAKLRSLFDRLSVLGRQLLHECLATAAVCQTSASGDLHLFVWYGEYPALWKDMSEVLEEAALSDDFYAGWVDRREHDHYGRLDLTASFGLSVQLTTHWDKAVDLKEDDGLCMAHRLVTMPEPAPEEHEPVAATAEIDSDLW